MRTRDPPYPRAAQEFETVRSQSKEKKCGGQATGRAAPGATTPAHMGLAPPHHVHSTVDVGVGRQEGCALPGIPRSGEPGPKLGHGQEVEFSTSVARDHFPGQASLKAGLWVLKWLHVRCHSRPGSYSEM